MTTIRGVRVVTGESANHLSTLGVSLLGHRARVDDAQVRLIVFTGILVTNAEQTLTHVLGFVLVDFAPERVRLDTWSHTTYSGSGSMEEVIEPAHRAMRLSLP